MQAGKWSYKVDAGENAHTRRECPWKLGNSHVRWTQCGNGHMRKEYPCKMGNGCPRLMLGENAHTRWEMFIQGGHKVRIITQGGKWSYKVDTR